MTEGNERQAIHKMRSGNVEAIVYENCSGGEWSWHSVRIGRWRWTKHGAGREANTFAHAELRQVAHVARLAEGWLTRHVIHGVDMDSGRES